MSWTPSRAVTMSIGVFRLACRPLADVNKGHRILSPFQSGEAVGAIPRPVDCHAMTDSCTAAGGRTTIRIERHNQRDRLN
jgi:hypothetical protein